MFARRSAPVQKQLLGPEHCPTIVPSCSVFLYASLKASHRNQGQIAPSRNPPREQTPTREMQTMNDSPNFDPKQMSEVAVLEHDRQLLSCRFSPCGKFVFAGGMDHHIHRWELVTSKHTSIEGHSSWIGSLDFHSDGERMLSADYVGAINCWQYANENPKPTWTRKDAHASAIRSLVVSPNGNVVATSGHDMIVRAWSAESGKPLWESPGHSSPVFSSVFHPDGNSVVTAEQFGIVKQWNADTGKHERDLDVSMLWTDASLSGGAHTCGIRDVRFLDNGNVLVCSGLTELKDGDRRGGNATIVFIDWKTAKPTKTLAAKGAGYVERFMQSDQLSIAACLTQENGSLQFWAGGNETPMAQVKAPCRDLDLHPDGNRIAVCEWAKHGKVGNNPSTDKLEEFEPHHGVIRIHSLRSPT